MTTRRDCETPHRDSPAYRAGRRAFLDGWGLDDNPHSRKDSQKRIDWFAGWLDARSANKFPNYFL